MYRKLVLCLLLVGIVVNLDPNATAREQENLSATDRRLETKSLTVPGVFFHSALSALGILENPVSRYRQMVQKLKLPEVVLEEPIEKVEVPVKTRLRKLPRFRYADLVLPLAEKHGMDWRLVAAVVAVESNFNPYARSEKGALGLMQVMPSTASLYRLTPDQLYDPAKNLEAGVLHLKKLHRRYSGDLEKILAAYNCGEGNVDRFGGVPPFSQTQAFVQKVLTRYYSYM